MLIKSLEVENFQSLEKVSLDLEPFTVIIGPSSSGKSALTRAVKMLAHNRRGTEFVSHGKTTAKVRAALASGHVVEIARSTNSGANGNYYEITSPSDVEGAQTGDLTGGSGEESQDSQDLAENSRAGNKERWTKLGGEVPQEVSALLGIDPKDTLFYASQFDKPYLLDDSPAEVARVLGALTNVSVIFEAARESNRNKLNTSSVIKTRQSDLEATTAALENYADLPARRRSVDLANEKINTARDLQQRGQNLLSLQHDLEDISRVLASLTIDTTPLPSTQKATDLQSTLTSALAVLEMLREVAETKQQAEKALGAIPDVTVATDLASKYRAAEDLLDALRAAAQSRKSAIDASVAAGVALDEAQRDYDRALEESSVCPTCGQSISPANSEGL